MKIEQIRIERYRSIREAKSINLEGLTVLIGRNNEGKSNILHAVNAAMSAITYLQARSPRNISERELPRRMSTITANRIGYSWERDFPIDLREGRSPQTSEITITFSLDEEEVSEFLRDLKSKIDGRLPVSVTFNPDNSVQLAVRKQGKGGAALNKKISAVAFFISRRLRFEYIEAVRTAKRASEEVQRIVERTVADLNDEEVIQEALSRIEVMQGPILKQLSEDLTRNLKQFLPNIKSARITLNNEEQGLSL